VSLMARRPSVLILEPALKRLSPVP
jgi:hypothetical protein